MGARTQGFGALGARARVKDMLVTDTPATAVDATLRALLADVLGLGEARAAALTDDSGLFGELPEFDSMAVATVLTEMEDRLGILIDDDAVDGEIFETYGNLLAVSVRKVAGRGESRRAHERASLAHRPRRHPPRERPSRPAVLGRSEPHPAHAGPCDARTCGRRPRYAPARSSGAE